MDIQGYLLAAQIACTASLLLAAAVVLAAALSLRASAQSRERSESILETHINRLTCIHSEMMDTLAAAANLDVARFRAAQRQREAMRSSPDPSTIEVGLSSEDKASA